MGHVRARSAKYLKQRKIWEHYRSIQENKRFDGDDQGYEERRQALSKLGFKNYRAYLDSPYWKRIRSLLLPDKDVDCRCCLRKKATQIHHQSYIWPVMVGLCLTDLIPLCGGCHLIITFTSCGNKRSFAKAVTMCKRLMAKAKKTKAKRPKCWKCDSLISKGRPCRVCRQRETVAPLPEFTKGEGEAGLPCPMCRDCMSSNGCKRCTKLSALHRGDKECPVCGANLTKSHAGHTCKWTRGEAHTAWHRKSLGLCPKCRKSLPKNKLCQYCLMGAENRKYIALSSNGRLRRDRRCACGNFSGKREACKKCHKSKSVTSTSPVLFPEEWSRMGVRL